MQLNISNTDNCKKLNLNFNAWKIFSNSKTEIIQIELKPDEIISAHINEVDVVFYILSGAGSLNVLNDTYLLKKGDCVFIPRNLQREWKNKLAEHLKMLVIK